MKNRRVVVTGLGVVAPNGHTVADFNEAIQNGTSGITHFEELEKLNFSCQVAGIPKYNKDYLNNYFTQLQQRGLLATGLEYGVIAGMDAWKDAKLPVVPKDESPNYDAGIIMGSGTMGVGKFREAILKVDEGKVRRLGSTTVLQTMASGVSAYLGGILGCGNMVTTNSSACSTGTEAILLGYERIQSGNAEVMLVGSTSDSGPYIWGGFDAMRILPSQYNHRPEQASRPMSQDATGFVPGSGAGALVLESLDSALQRDATIYAEILGGHVNNGGQRKGGSLTAPNNEAVQRCIQKAVANAQIDPNEIDAINGHLTATTKDPVEIDNWSKALDRSGSDFPYVNSLKSMIGHCIAASGSIESVASVLQLHHGFIFGNINCEPIHADILIQVDSNRIVQKTQNISVNIIAKASFGFGDVNACVIFKKFKK
ncbi:beta-ketoacyl-[acyl-carrier-protein] synthase family protein [Aquimarina sp. ERC-38]|uniref:beta-ketoacyl-[acyl-carrier-protein] synthase family protein n=1 Tax=Aquimarina sp. ERC-38 TaxID=2949996 RepID=UPI002247649B|nr:beta-ketoacyl-[acyl-carrier-protein] synthase family protein [Aquimarina sp. ERC-38]UZO80126.1 beta-ketoacyl-[acyl-carrier-protein] synthase family protein [Aquimarina sp. ERC-38]